MRLVEHLRVQPADHLSTAARPERPVGVLRKHQMVRAETRADMCELFGLWIVNGEVASGSGHRIELRRRMARSVFAEIRIGRRTYGGSNPHSTFFIDHRIVDVVPAGPDRFLAPVR